MARAVRQGMVVLMLGALFSAPWPILAIASDKYALIVAVSQYPNLPEKLWLQGPRNDADLVRDFLLSDASFGFTPANITVLADGVAGADDPTLGAIRSQMALLAQRSKPGDFVYLHFAGHGTQAPAIDPASELDGLDELFLPMDIAAWDPATATVENALVDDEIGQMIDAIRATGADVWAVFDNCHSGTVTRDILPNNPLDHPVSRRLSPAALGIAPETLRAAATLTRGDAGDERVNALTGEPASDKSEEESFGSLVAFFAAQTNQETPELPLPAGSSSKQRHGLFAYTLVQTLARNPALSYRQLAQEILRQYALDYRLQPTPMFEGPLDQGVFGRQSVPTPPQWPLQLVNGGISISAGRLHGIEVGDALQIVDSAVATAPLANASFAVTEVGPLSAKLTMKSSGFLLVKPDWWARKGAPQVDFGLTVARPQSEEIGDIGTLLDNIMAAGIDGLRLQLVAYGEPADVQLVTEEEILWLVGGDGVIRRDGANKSISITMVSKSPQQFAAALADSLVKIARVNNLTRLGQSMPKISADLKVEFTAQSASGEMRPLSSSSMSQVRPGDIVYVQAANIRPGPVDLNILYVGSDYSISFIYNARLNSGDKLELDLFDVTDESFGREQILLVATPARPQSATEDLQWLEQDEVPRTRASGPDAGMETLLAEALFGERLRTTAGTAGSTEIGSISQIFVEVVSE